MFNINFDTLISNLLPRFNRKGKMLTWMHSLLYPVTLIYAEFLSYRDQKLYDARITGQVELLEWMLNDKFYNNGALRSIYIEDNNSFENEVYIYNSDENETETYIFNTSENELNTYIFNASEGLSGSDFTVWVPSNLVFDQDYMEGLISYFKLAGTTFQIKTY